MPTDLPDDALAEHFTARLRVAIAAYGRGWRDADAGYPLAAPSGHMIAEACYAAGYADQRRHAAGDTSDPPFDETDAGVWVRLARAAYQAGLTVPVAAEPPPEPPPVAPAWLRKRWEDVHVD